MGSHQGTRLPAQENGPMTAQELAKRMARNVRLGISAREAHREAHRQSRVVAKLGVSAHELLARWGKR